MSCVWITDGSLMVQVCMCVSIYGVCLVGKAQQWCLGLCGSGRVVLVSS